MRKKINNIKSTINKRIPVVIKGDLIRASKDDVYVIQLMVAKGMLSPSDIKGLDIRPDGVLIHPSGLNDLGDIVSKLLLELSN